VKRLKFHVSRGMMFGPDIQLYMHSRLSDQIAVPEPIVFKALSSDGSDYGEIRPPLLTLSRDEGQELMDELWNVGLRPSEGSGSAGSLAATERHLADMRTLVFKTPTT
jgi:hypothetical protein